MTRERISEGLMLLVMGLANQAPVADTPAGWQPHEWAYVKGVASSEILRLRALIAATEGR